MISHADMLGINLDRLETERFSHPEQVKFHRTLRERSQSYWGTGEPARNNWITLKEATALVHYHHESIRRWIRAGLIRSDKVGSRVLVHEDELKSFVATRRHKHPDSD